MILNKIKSNRKGRGFTIVELLVVIVVIGILAAITIVAYTGFTNRAKASQSSANANSALQVVSAYTADSSAAGIDGGGGVYATTANIMTALGSYTGSKLPSDVTLVNPTTLQPHPLVSDMTNNIATIYYSANGTQTGACISYWDTAKAGGAGVTTLLLGAAISYATTGVCT